MTDNDNGDVQRTLGQLEGKMDMLINEVRTSTKVLFARAIGAEERISSLETWRTRIIAAGAVITGLAGIIAWAIK